MEVEPNPATSKRLISNIPQWAIKIYRNIILSVFCMGVKLGLSLTEGET
jgi:hypothetical protein